MKIPDGFEACVDETFVRGFTTIPSWQSIVWFGHQNCDALLFTTFQTLFNKRFSEFYGEIDDSALLVIRGAGETIFLNGEIISEAKNYIDLIEIEKEEGNA